jgi:hypothetical protein
MAIFFFVFLYHVFLSVGNIKAAWELFLIASTANVPVNFSSFQYICLSNFLIPIVAPFLVS